MTTRTEYEVLALVEGKWTTLDRMSACAQALSRARRIDESRRYPRVRLVEHVASPAGGGRRSRTLFEGAEGNKRDLREREIDQKRKRRVAKRTAEARKRAEETRRRRGVRRAFLKDLSFGVGMMIRVAVVLLAALVGTALLRALGG